jgi:hypothetical protein
LRRRATCSLKDYLFCSLIKEKVSSRASGNVVSAVFALSKRLWFLWVTRKELSIKTHIRGISTG